MGFKGTGGIGKDEQGPTYPILVTERPKRLGLGAEEVTSSSRKSYLKSTFVASGEIGQAAATNKEGTPQAYPFAQQQTYTEEPSKATDTGGKGEEMNEEARKKAEEDKKALEEKKILAQKLESEKAAKDALEQAKSAAAGLIGQATERMESQPAQEPEEGKKRKREEEQEEGGSKAKKTLTVYLDKEGQA